MIPYGFPNSVLKRVYLAGHVTGWDAAMRYVNERYPCLMPVVA